MERKMAGGRDLKGITVSIGADTTKLQSALAGVNKEVKNTQAQLKDVEKLLKLDPSNTELVRQKQKLLAGRHQGDQGEAHHLENSGGAGQRAAPKGRNYPGAV